MPRDRHVTVRARRCFGSARPSSLPGMFKTLTRTRVIGVLLSVQLLALPTAALEITNDKLYEKSSRAAQAALAFYGIYDNPAESQRVRDISYRLAERATFDEFPFSFYLIDMPVPNAFALPGGHVFITRGMLDLGMTDDMLACLMGHEIAHVVFSHGQRMQRRATLLSILSQAALLGVMIGVDSSPENPQDPYGIARSPSRKGSLVQGTAATGVVFTELLLRKFSRGFEDEADIEGQRLAAAAGFDPDGARALWQLMRERIPTSNDYGYWRTHPFSDQRQRAAEVRAAELAIQQERPVADFRAASQKAILDFRQEEVEPPKKDETETDRHRDRGRSSQPAEPEETRLWAKDLGVFLELSALTTWPRGPRAEELRLAELHRQRDLELAELETSRDYGALVRAYRQQIEEVQALTPKSAFIATLEKELDGLRDQTEATYPKSLDIWQSGIYQTPFLETFLSNFPTAEPASEIALALGNAYSRVRRQADAVEQYLRAAEAGTKNPSAVRAIDGLRNLTPYLENLVALQRLSERSDDPELAALARTRLREQVEKFEELANGAEFLRRYPESQLQSVVQKRIENLAQNLFGEIVLYQGLGDHAKALERIQTILEHAPMTAAAESLRQRAVIDT